MDLAIRFYSFQDARTMADLATAQPFRVRISDGRHWADAKSLLCLCSLDLCQPLTLRADCSGEEIEHLRALLGDFGA